MNSLLLNLVLICQIFVHCDSSNQAHTDKTSKKPLKVFILAGQSNMQGHARMETLEYLTSDPGSTPIWNDILTQDGKPRIHENVWINYLSPNGVKHGRLTTGYGADENKIGPELMFGIRTRKELSEPILIIKTAWGGKSLHTDFRPPSAPLYQFSDQQLERFAKQEKDVDALRQEKKLASGKYYRLMIAHVKSVLADIGSTYEAYDPEGGFELAGFVWFQGWNDMVDGGVYPNRNKPGGFDAYSELLGSLIQDVRKDLESPELRFVIGVMGVGGPTERYGKHQKRNQKVHQHFRDAMAATANTKKFRGTVANVFTENYWDQKLGELKGKESQISQQIRRSRKEQNWTQQEANQRKEEMMAEQFSPEQLAALKTGVSNQEYHYLGSAKIMTGIGQGFAEEMLKLQRNR